MDTDPDSDLLALVAKGVMKTALKLLMQRYGRPVFRYCREALRDPVLADDVHQQVFIQAHRDLPRFNGQSKVKTWLFAIAHHRVLDAAKQRKRAQSHVEEGDATTVADPRPLVGERIDEVRLIEALVLCFEHLRENVRNAVLLRFQQGFTFEQMAMICEEKPGTLQAQVSRALPVLRTCIEARMRGAA